MKKILALVVALVLTLSLTAAFADGIKIAIPNDATNEGRALLLLQAYGVLKVDEKAGITATVNDITENPLGIEFTEVEAALVPNTLPDVDYAIINGNYALAAELPAALLYENAESPYVNVVCVNEANKDSDQAKALSGLFRDLRLPETLARRSEELTALGREQSAAEYRQLWDLAVEALEQCDRILGDAAMDYDEFGRLFLLVLSQYDIGTIPVSLDRVTAGDFDRNRRRDIKHLIVLGASDQRLPKAEESGGVFSLDERQRLLEKDIDLGAGGDSELWREFSLIYYTLTLPSESLTLLCPLTDGDGGALRPAFVFRRAQSIFGLTPESADLVDARMSARAPALALAAEALRGGDGREQAARAYFAETEPERMRALETAAVQTRGSLSPAAVERLLELQTAQKERS